MALAATLSAAPSLGTRILTGVKLNSVARGYPTTRVVDECSFPYVMAGGPVVRILYGALTKASLDWIAGHQASRPMCSSDSVRPSERHPCSPPAAPALSRKFLVTLAIVANSAPDTSTLAWDYGAATMDNGQDPRPRVSLCIA
ncbi:hypothetical protein EDB85DRAFT_1891117 [Lactarius pseudohatsudake]|nr:hypothetical protein EDB85DRAFT_1891117 [Lactarius pseudohatsudake]